MEKLVAFTAQLQKCRWRRLLVISGTFEWCVRQVDTFIGTLLGDWLWVSEHRRNALKHCRASAMRSLLGREFQHAVFDAFNGMHTEALVALAGTLKAGSWLVMLVPEWQVWSQLPDADTLRWSESESPRESPHFISRLQQLILSDARNVLWRQQNTVTISSVLHPLLPSQCRSSTRSTRQQQLLLTQLLTSAPGIQIVMAARGRGKSALAGMLVARWPNRCLVTAPCKVSTSVLAEYAGNKFCFIAPDRLLAEAKKYQPSVDWLLIDEAAAIPIPLLKQLVTLFPRVLLTTTVQGYEGTGRGFLLKLCTALPNLTLHQLDQPLRWAPDDPLEAFINKALLFNDSNSLAVAQQVTRKIDYVMLRQHDWVFQPDLMAAIYQLLTSTHYRTSPLDLRRMMDAPGMHFIAAVRGTMVQGALWLVDEGNLSLELTTAVWAGYRRPRGNLVAQSLAAHSGQLGAPMLRSRRISRIAVVSSLRRAGIGKEMVDRYRQQAQGLDYLAVSFGFTQDLWRFWQRCNFQLVSLGTQREASSGCYSATALLPLSELGNQLVAAAERRLERDGYWLRQWVEEHEFPFSDHCYIDFDNNDWRELAGFAWAQRPIQSSLPALGRLLFHQKDSLPLLQALLVNKVPTVVVCAEFNLSGRKALLTAQRKETASGLINLDARRAMSWQQWVNSLPNC